MENACRVQHVCVSSRCTHVLAQLAQSAEPRRALPHLRSLREANVPSFRSRLAHHLWFRMRGSRRRASHLSCLSSGSSALWAEKHPRRSETPLKSLSRLTNREHVDLSTTHCVKWSANILLSRWSCQLTRPHCVLWKPPRYWFSCQVRSGKTSPWLPPSAQPMFPPVVTLSRQCCDFVWSCARLVCVRESVCANLSTVHGPAHRLTMFSLATTVQLAFIGLRPAGSSNHRTSRVFITLVYSAT